jgi:hypothetical protein
MALRLLTLMVGSVAGAAVVVPPLDLPALIDRMYHHLDVADAILADVGTEVTTESSCGNVQDFAQRLFVRIGWVDVARISSELSECSAPDRHSVIQYVKRTIISETIMVLTNHRALLVSQQRECARISHEASYEEQVRVTNRRSEETVQMLGWLRDLRNEYADACANVPPIENRVRCLRDRILLDVIPIEQSTSDALGLMLQTRSRTRAFVQRNHSDKATMGHALRRVYAIMRERNDSHTRAALHHIRESHIVRTAQLPSKDQYVQILRDIASLDNLIRRIEAIMDRVG